MKIVTVYTLLLLLLILNVANANEVVNKEAELAQQLLKSDPHIVWHDFRKRLGSHPRVSVSMSDGGVITLWGRVSSPFERDTLEKLASRVEGVTKVVNHTGMK